MNIFNIFKDIIDFLGQIIAILTSFVNTIIKFINMIPEPFKTILIIFVPLFTIVTVWRFKK